MKSHSIVVSDADMAGLNRLVRALRHSLFRDQLQLELLNQTLESAEVASSESIKRGTIRMNSRIHVLDLDTGRKELYTLVFPAQTYLQASFPFSHRWGSLYSDVDSETSSKQEYLEGSGGCESSACCTEQLRNESSHIKQKGHL